MKKSELKELIKELVEDSLEEISTTGGVSGYSTPFAFSKSGKQNKALAKKSAEQVGYKLVDEDIDDNEEAEDENESLPLVTRELLEARSRYKNFKESDMMKNPAKISYCIQEAYKMMREVDYLLSLNEKLKTEGGVDNTCYWKRTVGHISKINELMKSTAKRLRRLSK